MKTNPCPGCGGCGYEVIHSYANPPEQQSCSICGGIGIMKTKAQRYLEEVFGSSWKGRLDICFLYLMVALGHALVITAGIICANTFGIVGYIICLYCFYHTFTAMEEERRIYHGK